LAQFVGSYDLVIDHALYPIYRTLERLAVEVVALKEQDPVLLDCQRV
jgi:hypothetical protein